MNEKLLRKIQKKKLVRNYTVNKEAIDIENRTVEIALSSEEPYERWFGIEILSHSQDSVDLSRLLNGAPLLAEHDSTKQIGVVESCSIDGDKVLRCLVRFSKNPLGTEYFNDIVDGIRSKVSVGYEIQGMEKTGEKTDENGLKICDIYTVTLWTPYEASIVSIPADDTVGVGRAKDFFDDTESQYPDTTEFDDDDDTEIDVEIQQNAKEKKDGEDDLSTSAAETVDTQETQATQATQQSETSDEENKNRAFDNTNQTHNNISITPKNKNNKDKNMQEIIALGKKYKKEALALDFIEKGKSEREFIEAVLEERTSEASKNSHDAGTAKELDGFRIADFVREQAENKPGRMVGMAKEFTQDAERNGRTLKRGGLIIPTEIIKKAFTRDYTVGTPANGGNTASNNYRPDVIDALYNQSVVLRHADIKPSATGFGQVQYPIITAKDNFYQITENQRANDTNVNFDAVTFTPKTTGGRSVISRNLLKESSIAIESVLVSSMLKKFREYQDWQLLNGTGANGDLLGLFNHTGMNPVVLGTNGDFLTFKKVVEFEADINAQNAQGAGGLVYLTNSKVASVLKATQKFASFGDAILENGEMNGYAVDISNQIASAGTKGTGTNLSSMILGNFEYCHYIEWDGYEFVVNPYRLGAGQVEYEMFATYDMQVSRQIAFSLATDIQTS